jgi:hypothetical protein
METRKKGEKIRQGQLFYRAGNRQTEILNFDIFNPALLLTESRYREF